MLPYQTPPKRIKTDIHNSFPYLGTFSQLPIYLFQVGKVDLTL